MTCNVCGGQLVFFENRMSTDRGTCEIWLCRSCFVLVHASACPAGASEEVERQAASSASYYRVDPSTLRTEIDGKRNMLSSGFFSRYLSDLDRKVLLDVGCGMGTLLVAAAEMGFRRAIGVDINTASFAAMAEAIPIPPQVTMLPSMDLIDEPADIAVLWHALEHVYEPNPFLAALVSHLKDGAMLFFQVPQYRQEYIFDTHYYFYNESSLRAVLGRHGFSVKEFLYDHDLQFLALAAAYDAPKAEKRRRLASLFRW